LRSLEQQPLLVVLVAPLPELAAGLAKSLPQTQRQSGQAHLHGQHVLVILVVLVGLVQ
jgi:hypothetical protein